MNREFFTPNLPITEIIAHAFLRSIHNITIERGWLQLRLQWGDNVKVFWDGGVGLYDSLDPNHLYVLFFVSVCFLTDNGMISSKLVHWLWPTLIQQELDELKDRLNNHVTRFDKNKKLPSGVSPNVCYSLVEEYGGENCLQLVDTNVVRELMEVLGGEELLRWPGVDDAYIVRAKAVFAELGVGKLSFDNVWDVFEAMLPSMSNN